MAVFHLKAGFGSRAGGQSARAKSDYIEREGRYEKDGEELEHKEHENMPEWARGRPRKILGGGGRARARQRALYSEVQFALAQGAGEAERRELAGELRRTAVRAGSGCPIRWRSTGAARTEKIPTRT